MSAGSPRALSAVVALLLVFAIGSIVALAVLVATLAEDEETTSATSCTVTAGTTDNDNGEERALNIPNGWAPLVEAAAQTAGLPVSVVAAQLAQESRWNPDATSPAGAQGIAQFMPATWATTARVGTPSTLRTRFPLMAATWPH